MSTPMNTTANGKLEPRLMMKGLMTLSTVLTALFSDGSDRTTPIGEPPSAEPDRPASTPPEPRAAIAAENLPTNCPCAPESDDISPPVTTSTKSAGRTAPSGYSRNPACRSV